MCSHLIIGVIMVPRRLNLYGSASGFSVWTNHSPLRLRRLEGRLRFLGGARQALAMNARRVRKDVKGP